MILKQSPKYLSLISYLYLTFMLADQVLMYRMVQVGMFTITAGIFLMPLYYFTGDMIAEVYGFKTARHFVVLVVFSSIIFAVLITGLNMLPKPHDWMHKLDYEHVLGHLLRSTIGGFFAVLAGSYLNAFILSKLKILANGRFFILRALTSSALGEAIQMVIGCILLFSHSMPFCQMWRFILHMYVWQLSLGVLVATIGSMFVSILKKVEGEPDELRSVHFNPFNKNKV